MRRREMYLALIILSIILSGICFLAWKKHEEFASDCYKKDGLTVGGYIHYECILPKK